MSLDGIGKIFYGLRQVVFYVLDAAKNAFNSFLDWLNEKTGGKLSGIIETIRALFNNAIYQVKDFFAGAIASVKKIFEGLVEFIGGVFSNDWDLAWKGIKDIFKGIINGIITIFEGFVNGAINGLNMLINGLNKLISVGGIFEGINVIPPINRVNLPRLATGAVIPPNREFMAVLGDQKSGTNIETPLETMVQAFRTALNEGGGNRGTAYLMVDRTVLGQLVYDLNNAESQRVGVKLVKGGV